MKKAMIMLGYLTSLCVAISMVFKFLHFPGANALLYITGIIVSVFLAGCLLLQLQDTNKGKLHRVHLAGSLAAVITGIGVTARLQHWAGADVLLITGLGGICLILFPGLLYFKSKQGGSAVVNTAGAVGMMLLTAGILFKLEYWPGATTLLSCFPVPLFLIYFPAQLMTGNLSSDEKEKFLRRGFLALVAGGLITMYFIKSIEIHDLQNVPENTWYEKASAQATL